MRPEDQAWSSSDWDGWKNWLDQARDDQETYATLYEHRRWAPACFFALQAIEKAMKALARNDDNSQFQGIKIEGERLPDGTMSNAGFENLTYADLVAGWPLHKHSFAKLVEAFVIPMYQDIFQPFRAQFQRLDGGQWYENTRYPHRHRGMDVAPFARFTESDAKWLGGLADKILHVVAEQMPTEERDWDLPVE